MRSPIFFPNCLTACILKFHGPQMSSVKEAILTSFLSSLKLILYYKDRPKTIQKPFKKSNKEAATIPNILPNGPSIPQ